VIGGRHGGQHGEHGAGGERGAVLWLAWDAAKGTLMPSVTLVGGFENAEGGYWGRPVDAVPGPDGALYISDDTAGAIYRLAPAA
jgi:glucose/arabinose dehydrogenase